MSGFSAEEDRILRDRVAARLAAQPSWADRMDQLVAQEHTRIVGDRARTATAASTTAAAATATAAPLRRLVLSSLDDPDVTPAATGSLPSSETDSTAAIDGDREAELAVADRITMATKYPEPVHCRAAMPPNVQQRYEALARNYAKLPAANGCVPNMTVRYQAQLPGSNETVDLTHSLAQAALVAVLDGTVTRQDVTAGACAIECKPGDWNGPRDRELTATEVATTQPLADYKAAALAKSRTISSAVYLYRQNSWFVAVAGDTEMQLAQMMRGRGNPITAIAEARAALLATTGNFKLAQVHALRSTGKAKWREAARGVIEVAEDAPGQATTGLVELQALTMAYPADCCATPEPLKGATFSKCGPGETTTALRTPEAAAVHSRYHRSLELQEQQLSDLCHYNPDACGLLVTSIGKWVRQQAPATDGRPTSPTRRAVADLCCIGMAAHALGALRPSSNGGDAGSAAETFAAVTAHCVLPPTAQGDARYEQWQPDAGVKDLLHLSDGSAGFPSAASNCRTSKMYAPSTVVPPTAVDVAATWGLDVDTATNGTGSMTLVTTARPVPIVAHPPPSAGGSVSAKRLARMLAPEVTSASGWASYDRSAAPRLSAMCRTGEAAKPADRLAGCIIARAADLLSRRETFVDMDQPTEEQAERHESALARAVAGAMAAAHMKHMEPVVCAAYKRGRTLGCNKTADDMPVTALNGDEQGLINRGFMTPGMSAEMSEIWGALKREWKAPKDRPSWPLANAHDLRSWAEVAKSAGDPGLATMRQRFCDLNTAVAGWLVRVLGHRSRSGLATWLAGPGWCVVRMPDPPPNADGDTPRRAVFMAVQADPVTSGPWKGWTPKPHGWQSMRTLAGNVIWRVMEGEPFEFDSAVQRPARDTLAASVICSPQLEAGGSGPFNNALMANTLLLGAAVDKRLMQHVFDTLGYCWRGAGRVSELAKLITEVHDTYSQHPMTGLLLGVGLAVAGTTTVDAEAAHAVMTLVKLAGTIKESNQVHNRRSTYQDVVAHLSFGMQSLSRRHVETV